METASFTGVIKAIFYLILIYYVFKFLLRIFLPILLKKAAEKAAENFKQQQYNSTRQNEPPLRDPARPEKGQGNKTVGEYVDFEELE